MPIQAFLAAAEAACQDLPDADVAQGVLESLAVPGSGVTAADPVAMFRVLFAHLDVSGEVGLDRGGTVGRDRGLRELYVAAMHWPLASHPPPTTHPSPIHRATSPVMSCVWWLCTCTLRAASRTCCWHWHPRPPWAPQQQY